MKNKLLTIIFIFYLYSCDHNHDNLTKKIDALMQFHLKAKESKIDFISYKKTLKDYYDKCLTNLTNMEINKTDNESIKKLFYFSYLMSFYYPGTEYIYYSKNIFKEMEKRNIVTESEIKNMFGALIDNYYFEDALRIKDKYQYAKIKILTNVQINHAEDYNNLKNKIYVMEVIDLSNLKLKDIEMSNKNIILIIFRNGCDVCKRTFNLIVNDKELFNMVRKNAIFLIRASDVIDLPGFLSEIKKINDKYKIYFYLPYYHSSFLDNLDLISTPNFYFIKKGKIVCIKEGWGNNFKEERSLFIGCYNKLHN